MRLKEAIEILDSLTKRDNCYSIADQLKATKLGIEALKEVQQARLMSNKLPHTLLPDESPQ